MGVQVPLTSIRLRTARVKVSLVDGLLYGCPGIPDIQSLMAYSTYGCLGIPGIPDWGLGIRLGGGGGGGGGGGVVSRP